MTRFDDIIGRTDRIIEEAEETLHESFLLIRDALPPAEHDRYEQAIREQVKLIQHSANVLFLELREVEHASEKRRVTA